jgi:hypothetical protein
MKIIIFCLPLSFFSHMHYFSFVDDKINVYQLLDILCEIVCEIVCELLRALPFEILCEIACELLLKIQWNMEYIILQRSPPGHPFSIANAIHDWIFSI